VRTVVFIAVLLWVACYCSAGVIYVDVNGPNDPGTGTYEDPFRKIGGAVDSAINGDTIIVAQGRYYENIDIETNGIVLTSTEPNDSTVVGKTIIDGNATDSVIIFEGIEGSETVLSGFTITNGYANYGGGVHCINGSGPAIISCVISGNVADNYGGGICCFDSSNPAISNCIISGNSTAIGGGTCFVDSNGTIANCLISDNLCDYGGAVACITGTVFITNCTVTGNSATEDGNGLACNSPQQDYPSNLQINNCILWDQGNEIWNNDDSTITISYSDVYGDWPGVSNIFTSPRFGPDGYHLQPDSPCINSGEPLADYSGEVDIDGEPRVVDGCVDIGCDEFVWMGDLDYNGDVNWTDLKRFVQDWQQTGDGRPADFNDDKVVNFGDFAVLAENWMLVRRK